MVGLAEGGVSCFLSSDNSSSGSGLVEAPRDSAVFKFVVFVCGVLPISGF